MTDLATRLRGSVIPAVPVPFGAEGRIDEQLQRDYARWMAHQTVGAVAIWAHTGRGMWLDSEQRRTVLDCWRSALGEIPIVCGVGVPADASLPNDPGSRAARAIELTIEMTRSAKNGGASAVLVHPPAALRNLPDVESYVVELHAAVAAVGLPVFAFYLYEAAGGISYSPNVVERLLQLDGVIGIKLATLDSVMTFQDVAAVVRQAGDALLVTGEDRFLGYSLMMGADAALVGVAAACTDRIVALVHAWVTGDLQGFARFSNAVDLFARATFVSPMEGYVQRMLWALEADGVIGSTTDDPFGPDLPQGEREAVTWAVRGLRSA